MTTFARPVRALCGEHGAPLTLLAAGAPLSFGPTSPATCSDGCVLDAIDVMLEPGTVLMRAGAELFVIDDSDDD